MKVFVMNCGSSSIKCQVIDMDTKECMMKGYYERIGSDQAFLGINVRGEKAKIDHPAHNFEEAISEIFRLLVDEKYGVLNDLSEISAVGHRIVHGGEKFVSSVVVDEDVIAEIERCIELAPLHNPAAVAGIKACQKLLPGVPMVTVFDTAFHQTMPEKAYIYQIPYEYYEKDKIRKYGAHGTSHRYVAKRISEIKGNDNLRIVNCHLGQGASLCAIKDGKAMDTTMGFTPLAGIPMGTRSGDLDPSIVTTIMKKYDLSPDEMDTILNKKSGALGVSGVSSDSRDIEKAASEGNKRAILALESRSFIEAQYIAKMIVAAGGIDVLTFAGGIGENGIEERERICAYLECFGIKLDKEKNQVKGKEVKISADDSAADIYIIPTNEELMIALDTQELVENK